MVVYKIHDAHEGVFTIIKKTDFDTDIQTMWSDSPLMMTWKDHSTPETASHSGEK